MIKYFIPVYGLYVMWKDPFETDSFQFVMWFIMFHLSVPYLLSLLILLI